jgi:hypothetical protein
VAKTQIEKFKLDEEIRLTYLTMLGDVLATAKKLGLTKNLSYVKDVCERYRRTRNRDVEIDAAKCIASYIVFGFEERVAYLRELLQRLDERDVRIISLCHRADVYTDDVYVDDKSSQVCKCVACDRECIPVAQEQIGLINTKLDIIREIDKETNNLVTNICKMGFHNRDAPQIGKIQQNIVMLSDEKKFKTNDEKAVALAITEMTPPERQKFRRNLLKRAEEIKSTTTMEGK